jgi:hypothetical protein
MGTLEQSWSTEMAMERGDSSLAGKIQRLTPEQVAEVQEFIESLHRGARAAVRSSAALSEPAFGAVWNNPEDDVYDAA